MDFSPFIQRLRKVVSFARELGLRELKRDKAARLLWHEVYPSLSEGRPGLLGAVTSRAEAQVMRLALIYALLDCSESIGRTHLQAALTVWRYAAESVRYIFGDALGDPFVDELLAALRAQPEGLTRTEIREHFGRHRRSLQIERGLAVLAEQRLARVERVKTQGRPAERWMAVAECAVSAESYGGGTTCGAHSPSRDDDA